MLHLFNKEYHYNNLIIHKPKPNLVIVDLSYLHNLLIDLQKTLSHVF